MLAGCGSDRCHKQQGIMDEYSIIEYEEERYEESDPLCESHNQEPEYLHQLVRAGEFMTLMEMEALEGLTQRLIILRIGNLKLISTKGYR